MTQKILFVGAGAIGSDLGAFLARAGHDVTFEVARGNLPVLEFTSAVALKRDSEPGSM